MKSPFPGMNPWLEGHLWPDVHSRLAQVISELLAPQIAPKYVARLALATIMDSDPESEIGITYPDVEVLHRLDTANESVVVYGGKTMSLTEPTIVMPFTLPIPVKFPIVEVRDVANNKLITAIEILSPVNKRNPNLIEYRKKIDDLHKRGVHIIEIDSLRRGTRPFSTKKAVSHYQILLLRAQSNNALIWSANIQDKLPVLPVPLRRPDPDVFLDLGNAMDIIFERSLYYLSLDYAKDPPPPTFSESDLAFIQEVVKQK